MCGAVALARSSTLWMPLRADEGGYLLVARQWHDGGEFLYGEYFVDRPPLLLLLFRVAALGGWDGWIRALAVPCAVVLVLAAARAGRWVGGARGARWSAAAGAAMVCSPAVAADQADGELFATVLVMLAVALTLQAWGTASLRHSRRVAVAAGAAAAAAPLVKQNAVEGVVLVLALLVVVLVRGGPGRDRAVGVGVAAAAGGAIPVALVAAWAWSVGAVPTVLWYDLYGFRADALEVVWSERPRATVLRAAQLVAIAAATGVLGIVITWASAVLGGSVRRSPQALAVSVLLAVGLVSVVAGGSFWPSYLVQLLPVVVLAVGLLAGREDRTGARARGWSRLLVATAVAGVVVELVVYAMVPAVWFEQRTGRWLAASAAPGDTAVVLYGHPSVLEAADLASPYPYLWSVPVRTLDPDLDRLWSTLVADDAPAWVVEMHPVDSWGIDDRGRVRQVLDERYRVLAEVCGNPVHVRRDLERTPAPAVRC